MRYIEGKLRNTTSGKRVKKDYEATLSDEAFEHFTALRKARKTLAEEDVVPAFAIFTDEQMAY